jgi:hypothetical protein
MFEPLLGITPTIFPPTTGVVVVGVGAGRVTVVDSSTTGRFCFGVIGDGSVTSSTSV